MRCWKLPDGRLLVEERDGVYHVMTSDGRMERNYWSGQGSEREHLNTTTYFVEAGELRSRFEDDNTDVSDAPPVVQNAIEARGLVPTTHPGIETLVKAGLAALKAGGKEAAQREKDRLAAFERDLPEF